MDQVAIGLQTRQPSLVSQFSQYIQLDDQRPIAEADYRVPAADESPGCSAVLIYCNCRQAALPDMHASGSQVLVSRWQLTQQVRRREPHTPSEFINAIPPEPIPPSLRARSRTIFSRRRPLWDFVPLGKHCTPETERDSTMWPRKAGCSLRCAHYVFGAELGLSPFRIT